MFKIFFDIDDINILFCYNFLKENVTFFFFSFFKEFLPLLYSVLLFSVDPRQSIFLP